MATADIPKIEAGNLFNVNGLNVVITGAGSGMYEAFIPRLSYILCLSCTAWIILSR